MSDNQRSKSSLDPALRERLLKESQTPWQGLRRLLWFALFASAGLGLFTMAFRASAGDAVDLTDLGIQAGALLLFSRLLWFDRERSSSSDG